MHSNTMLLRQVYPSWVDQSGNVTWQIFHPRPIDNKLLSVDNGDMVSAEESFLSFIERGMQSVGVFGVTVQECGAQDLSCIEAQSSQNLAHSVIDFSGHNAYQTKKLVEI